MTDLSLLVTSGAVLSALVSVVGALAAVLSKYKVERKITHDSASPELRNVSEATDSIDRMEKLVVMVSELRKYQVEDKELLEKIQFELQRIQSESKQSTISKASLPPSDA